MTEPVVRMTAAHVLAHRDGDHVLVSDGEIVYRGTRILHAGRGWGGPVDETIDCGDALIMPGFIDLDALADIDHALLDSWATPDLAVGQQWSADYFRSRRRDVFDPPERAVIREYALSQLLRHGVTTFMPIASESHSEWAETYDDMVEVARIAERLGIRGYLAPPTGPASTSSTVDAGRCCSTRNGAEPGFGMPSASSTMPLTTAAISYTALSCPAGSRP